MHSALHAAFNWHDHIVLDHSFSPHERALIGQAFDTLAGLPDGEGRALLAGAVRRAGGTLQVTRSTDGSAATFPDNHLKIDFAEASEIYFIQADGSHRHPSLTGVLVHELFHLNDYSTDMGFESSLVRPAMRAALQSLPAEEVARFSGELNHVDIRLLEDLSSSNAGSVADITATLRNRGNPHLASFVEKNGISVFRQALEESGLLDEHDHIRTEEAATRFTDQFMQKHFGDAEPQRGRYGNAGLDPKPSDAQPTVLQPLAHTAIVSGFMEDYAVAVPSGTPALPTVIPTNSEAAPSPPAHPFAHLLNGVSLNLQDVAHTPLSDNPDRGSVGAVATLPSRVVDRGAAANPMR